MPITQGTTPCCPCCQAPVRRVRRYFSDRMLSLFRRVHRFRCDGIGCGWEGTLPVTHDTGKVSYRSRK